MRSLAPPALLVVLFSVLGAAGGAQAASVDYNHGFARLKPVSDARLDALRGGFTVSQGGVSVDLAMGIERLTYINGQLVAASNIDGAALPSQTLRVIQNGPGNMFDTANLHLLPGTVTTVIQNSLDQQVIRNVNLLNLTVTSRALAEALSLQSSVRDTLTSVSH